MLKRKIVCLLVFLSLVLPLGPFAVASETRTLNYVLNGKKGSVTVTLEQSTYEHIYNVPRLSCTQIPNCSSITERDRRIITEETQKAALAPLVAAIKAKTKKAGDQARIAVSLAQNIPYDWDKSDQIDAGQSTHFRYPYEVLYDNKQICSENSYLIAFLLTELGFGASVFIFPNANHDTAGIKCPAKYSYQNTGFCFIESTSRKIITYDTMASRDSSGMILEDLTPTGLEFSPKTDYTDAQKYKNLSNKKKLTKKNRKTISKIRKRYGL